MSKKSLIGLLSNNLQPVSMYQNINSSLINLIKFTSTGIHWKQKKIQGILLANDQWKPAITEFPDAVYNRCYHSSMAVTGALAKVIGPGKVFNGITHFNKYRIYSILKSSSLGHFMIPTYLYDTKVLLNMLYNQPVLIKPALGNMGKSVYRISLENFRYKVFSESFIPIHTFWEEELIDYVNNRFDANKFIMQPFISFASIDGHIFDLRMLVQKNKFGNWDVTAGVSRLCFTDHFITNTSYDVRPIDKVIEKSEYSPCIISEMKQISIQAAKLLENSLCPLGEISVDFGIDINGRLLIIEINGMPQKHLFSRVDDETYRKTVIVPLQYAVHLSKS